MQPPPRRLAKWTIICGISAVPSFLFAAREFSPVGMFAGIATFVALYTVVSGTECFNRIEGLPFVRRTLLIGYGTRLVISVVFPVGVLVDILPGIISVSIVQSLVGPGALHAVGPTFLITLIQGSILNAVLGAYLAALYVVQRVCCRPPVPPDAKLCSGCGYDLRASLQFGRCPECGRPCEACPMPAPAVE